MRKSRLFLNTLLGVVIGAAACSSEPTAPPALEVQSTFDLTGNLTAVLMNCTPLSPVTRSEEVGPGGGEVWVGPHYLVIPKNALQNKVRIRGEIVRGNINAVRFYPEGLQFGKGAKIYLSYKNCSGPGLRLVKKIVYVDEALNLLEILSTRDDKSEKMLVADLRHFSQYAVAY